MNTFRKLNPLIKRHRHVPWIDNLEVKAAKDFFKNLPKSIHLVSIEQLIRFIKNSFPLNHQQARTYIKNWDPCLLYIVRGKIVLIYRIFENRILVIGYIQASQRVRALARAHRTRKRRDFN